MASNTKLVGDAHGYTRSKAPWVIDPATSKPMRLLTRGIEAFDGGAMRETPAEIAAREARKRFLASAAVIAAVWIWVLI